MSLEITGDAEQPGLFVEEPLEVARVHAVPVDQVEQHPGVDRAAAGAHHETIQRREAHGRGHAPPASHGAHAGAVTQVRDHRAAGGGASIDVS